MADVIEKWSAILPPILLKEVIQSHIHPLLINEITDIWIPQDDNLHLEEFIIAWQPILESDDLNKLIKIGFN